MFKSIGGEEHGVDDRAEVRFYWRSCFIQPSLKAYHVQYSASMTLKPGYELCFNRSDLVAVLKGLMHRFAV